MVHGAWAPKGTPKDVIAGLNAAMMETLGDSDGDAALRASSGSKPMRDQQDAGGAAHTLQKTGAEKWWPIIKAANLKGQ